MIDGATWMSTPVDERKDLAHSIVLSLKELYPNSAPIVEVYNFAERRIAEGKWSIFRSEPVVKLK